MKKMLMTVIVSVALVLPIFAQVDHDYNANDLVPVVTATIAKTEVPPAVLAAVKNEFDMNNQLTWSKFPFALKEYGWVYDVGASGIPILRYEVTMKTPSGNDFWAVYNSNGELIETREMSKNIAVPASVQESLSKSQYKDWTVVGDKEIIRYYYDNNLASVEQHFRVTVEKNNVKRSISFNYQNKKGNM